MRYSTVLTERYYSNRPLGARRILPDFEDYEVEFDSTAVYGFDPEIGVHIAQDSLVLAEGDRRIELFENGKWAYVTHEGTLVLPEQEGRILLAGNGNWAPVREATVTVPGSSLKPEAQTSEAADAKAAAGTPTKPATVQKTAAAGDTTSTAAPSAQPEKVYYTIKKGDTLSKIAKQHHTTINKLCQLNGITAKTILRVGRKLRVK